MTIRITISDPDTGEVFETKDLTDDYLIICEGTFELKRAADRSRQLALQLTAQPDTDEIHHDVIDWRLLNRQQWGRGIRATEDDEGLPVSKFQGQLTPRFAQEAKELPRKPACKPTPTAHR